MMTPTLDPARAGVGAPIVQRTGRRVRTAAALSSCALSLAALSAGCEPEAEVKWRVLFACEQAATGVVLVRTRILSGDCDGEAIYEAELARDGQETGDVGPPGKLPPGSYGFEATSLDDAGEIVSSTCRVVEGRYAAVELVLSSASCGDSDAEGGSLDGGPGECLDPTSGSCGATGCMKGYWSEDPASGCSPVQDCAPGTKVENEPSESRDRACVPCAEGFSATVNAPQCTPWKECGPEEIELLAGSPTQDRVCGHPGDCGPGTYEASTSEQSTRVCMECPAGTFSDQVNVPACTTFTTCGQGLEEATPGSATADTECRDIDGCAAADPGGDSNPCNSKNLNAACIDSIAPATGYTCKCTAGFEPSAGTCVQTDACPNDPNKTAPGACGCGTPEVVRNGLVECTIFSEDFEQGLSRWSADGTWRTQDPAEVQPPNRSSSNRVAHSSGCSYCELTSRTFATAGAKKLTLSFVRYVDSELDVDSGEYLEVWVHSRGSWIRLRRYRPPDDNDDQWHLATFDLTSFAADDLQISFAAATGLFSEDVEIDDVALILSP